MKYFYGNSRRMMISESNVMFILQQILLKLALTS